MAFGEDSIQLPDGEELVIVDDVIRPAAAADPRETSLDLRRQAGAPVASAATYSTRSKSRAQSTI